MKARALSTFSRDIPRSIAPGRRARIPVHPADRMRGTLVRAISSAEATAVPARRTGRTYLRRRQVGAHPRPPRRDLCIESVGTVPADAYEGTRTRMHRTGWLPLVIAALLALPGAASAQSQSQLSPSQESAVPIPPGQIDAAIARIDGLAGDLMQRTGVPGMAIAVVHDDKVVYAKGFGVRKVGSPGRV